MKSLYSTFTVCLLSSLLFSQSPANNIKLQINSKIRGNEVLSTNSILSINTDGTIEYSPSFGYAATNFITGFNQSDSEMTVNFCPEDEDETTAMFSAWIKGTLRVNFRTNTLQFYEPCYGCENYQQKFGSFTFKIFYEQGDPIVLDGEYILTKTSSEGLAFNSGTVFNFANNNMTWDATINNKTQKLSVQFVEVTSKDSVSTGKTIWEETIGSFIMGKDNIFFKIDSKTNGLVRLDFSPSQKELEKRKKLEQERQMKLQSDNNILAKIEECINSKNAPEEAAELLRKLYFPHPLINAKIKQILTDIYATKSISLNENERTNFVRSSKVQLMNFSLPEGKYPLHIDFTGNATIETPSGKKVIQTETRPTINIGIFNIPTNATDTLIFTKKYEKVQNPEVAVHVNSSKPVGQKKNGALYLSGFLTKGFFDPILISKNDPSIDKGKYTVMETQNETTSVCNIEINSEFKKVGVESGKLHKRIPKIILRGTGMLVCVGLGILISGM